MVQKGWTEEEVFGICFESERERNRRRLQATVCDHHLKQVEEFLLYNELAIWRRENGFDRVEAVEKKWFGDHHSLPPTPEQYYAGLWLEVNALRYAISIPAKYRPRQKDSMDELLAKFEYAEIKRCIDKRCREEAQAKAQMTVKPVGTVQQCSPSSPNPDTPSNAYVKLDNNESTMSQELEELTSSSAGTGLKTPEQQGPPNEGTLGQRQTTANGFLTAGVGSSKERNIATSTTTTVAGISSIAATPSKRRLKTFNELNKPFDPGGREEQPPPWKAAVPLPFFSWGEAGRLLVCLSGVKLGGFLSVFSALFVYFPKLIFFLSQVNLISKTFSRDADK